MSTHYLPSTAIQFARLHAELPRAGLEEVETARSSDKALCLTDGRSRLWSFRFGKVGTYFVGPDGHEVEFILARLAEHFDATFFDEHDEVFETILKDLCATELPRRAGVEGSDS